MDSKVIVITGASSGIGATLARQLASEGHQLVLGARRESELTAIAQACGTAKAVVTDVTVRAQVEKLRDEAIAAWGHVDVWVNNAGRGIGRKVLELTDADFDEMVNVNLRSVLYGIQAIVPHFQQRGQGHLVNVSSFLGRVPLVSHRSLESAMKAALNSLTANLRMDLAQSHPNLQVSLVMPGLVDTGFAQHSLHGSPPVPSRTMVPQSADEVADIIGGVIENPRAEVFTTPTLRALAKRYYEDVTTFEAGMTAPALSGLPAALAERLKNRS